MPPSISGVVFNLSTAVSGCSKSSAVKDFDATPILARRHDLFTIDLDNETVAYKGSSATPKSQAAANMRHILAEGTFLYFFAKFCHGSKFKIKVRSRKRILEHALLALFSFPFTLAANRFTHPCSC